MTAGEADKETTVLTKKPAAKSAPRKTSKTGGAKKRTKTPAEPFKLSDAALDKLVAAIVEVVDYDAFKEIFGDAPEAPEEAEGIKRDARAAARKHLGG
jgi:hypothetical protein